MSSKPYLKIGAIIQARLTSKRLPQKILMKIGGKPILLHCIENTLKATEVDEVVVASPHKIPLKLPVPVFIGSENDVLKRYYDCAKKYNFEVIVRVTADCPFIDPEVIDTAVNYHERHNFRYTCFAPIDGLDVEVFNFSILWWANRFAKLKSDREHVTPWIRRATKLSIDTLHDLKKARAWYELGK